MRPFHPFWSICFLGLLFCSVAAFSQAPTNWVSRTSNTTSTLNGVAYGNGVFVAVGYNGTVLTSSDGVTWTPKNSGTNNTLYAVTYSEKWKAFVTVGDHITAVSNDNGNNWTVVPVGSLLKAVAAGYQFVAVGGEDVLITNYPWGGWTAQQLPSRPSLLAIACGNELNAPSVPADRLCIATGADGEVFSATIPPPTSPTPPTWSSLGCNFSGAGFDAITRTSGLNFVAIGEAFPSTPPYVLQKFASLTASSCSTKDAPDPATMYGVTYSGSYGVAVGYGEIMYSQNTFDWLTVPLSGTVLQSVAYGAGSFVAVGWNGAIYQSVLQQPTRVLQLAPASVNFGASGVGFTCQRQVTAKNTGNSALSISGTSSSNPVFHVSPYQAFPMSLQPGAQRNFVLEYLPGAIRSDAGSITFASNATNSVSPLQLSGSGVQAPAAVSITRPFAASLSYTALGRKNQPDWIAFKALFAAKAKITIPKFPTMTVDEFITMLKGVLQGYTSNKIMFTQVSARGWCDNDPNLVATATMAAAGGNRRPLDAIAELRLHIGTTGLVEQLEVDKFALQ